MENKYKKETTKQYIMKKKINSHVFFIKMHLVDAY